MTARSSYLLLLFAVWMICVAPQARAQRASAGAGSGVLDDTTGAVRGLHLEPGFRLSGKRLLVPVVALDENGRTLQLPPELLAVWIEGQPTAAADVVETVPVAILVISDLDLTSDVRVSQTITAPDSPHWIGVWDASADPVRHVPLQPAAGLAQSVSMPAPGAARLWDAVLAGIRELAMPADAPLRRVILVIGDLRGEDASVHPMIACLEAARDLAIPVHGVVIHGAGQAAAERLRHLVEDSGGILGSAASVSSALAWGLARIEAARGLILDDPGLTPPFEVVVAAGESGPTATTRIVARPRGRYAPGPGLVAAGLVLVAAAAGLLAWRQWRRRAVGYFVAVDGNSSWRRSIPAAGLSIGRGPGNGLVLADDSISKQHAQVRWHRGQVQLIDLRSTNGTQVGGRLVRTAALSDGDLVVFGDAVTVRFRQRAARTRDPS